MMRAYTNLLVSFIAVGSLLFGAAALASGHWIFENPKEPAMTPDLNLGKMNYDAYCASCHGKTAGGTGKGPTFISKVYHPGHHSDGAFYLAAKQGARAHHWKFGDMPAVPEVNDSQLEYIVNYVRAVQRANDLF